VGGSADGEVEAQLYEATREGGFGWHPGREP